MRHRHYSMTHSATTDKSAVPTTHSLLSDYVTLFKLPVSTMVVITAGAGFYFGSRRNGISPFNVGLLQTLIGVALVTCGSSALNQVLERKTDVLMRRTANRPMAANRISLAHGLILGCAAVFLGSLYLVHTTTLLTGSLALLAAIGYVAIYTPLKRVTTINTFMGAFPGALPPLIGWTAARGLIEWPGVALLAIVFVWQFPHFMAIGWIYREDYARAGIRVTGSLQPVSRAAHLTVAQALFCAVFMIPISLWPVVLHVTGYSYAATAILLGIGYFLYTVRFARIISNPNPEASRVYACDLLRASVIYLPLLLAAMVLDANGSLAS
jgi:protoheme IX farnesyltransferase